jgi:hypothetical protein
MPILRMRRNISSAKVSCQYCTCAETSQTRDHANTAPAQKHLLSQGIMTILRLRRNISSARVHANTVPAQKHLLSQGFMPVLRLRSAQRHLLSQGIMPILRLRRNISTVRGSCQYCACAETSPQPGDHANTAPAQKHLLSPGIMLILRLRRIISLAIATTLSLVTAGMPTAQQGRQLKQKRKRRQGN